MLRSGINWNREAELLFTIFFHVPAYLRRIHEAVIPFLLDVSDGGEVVHTGDFLDIRSQGLRSPVLVFEFSKPPGYARGGNSMEILSM